MNGLHTFILKKLINIKKKKGFLSQSILERGVCMRLVNNIWSIYKYQQQKKSITVL